MEGLSFTSTADWFGADHAFRPEMALTVTDERLEFRFRVDKPAHCADHARGEFVEGLWQMDVAELFCAGAGPEYQEINIAPSGAWWSALFSSYRQLDREVRFEPVITNRVEGDLWSVGFSCATDAIVPWRDLDPACRRTSVCAILYTPEPHYYAWNHQSGGEPDFHREDLFVKV